SFCKSNCWITSSSARHRTAVPAISVLKRRACCDHRVRISNLKIRNMTDAKIHPTAIIDPDAKVGAGVEIGPFSIIGPHATIGDRTVVQSQVVIEGEAMIGHRNFIGHGAFLGGASTFHQFMHIGRLVMVQGSSAFGKDLPPFVTAAERNSVFGLNSVGLRPAGSSEKDRDEIKAVFRLIYLSGLNTSQALEKAETMTFGAPAREFLDFVATSKKRGICPLKRDAGDDVSV